MLFKAVALSLVAIISRYSDISIAKNLDINL